MLLSLLGRNRNWYYVNTACTRECHYIESTVDQSGAKVEVVFEGWQFPVLSTDVGGIHYNIGILKYIGYVTAIQVKLIDFICWGDTDFYQMIQN